MTEKKLVGEVNNADLHTQEETDKEMDCIVKTDLRIGEIVAFDQVKERFRQVVRGQQYARLLADAGAEVPHGVLLFGPHGCGKSFMAEAFAGSFAEQTGRIIFRFSGDLGQEDVRDRLAELAHLIEDTDTSILILDDLKLLTEDDTGFKKTILLLFQEALRNSDVFYIVTSDYKTKNDDEIRTAFGLDEVIDIDYPSGGDIPLLMDHICNNFGFPYDFRSENEQRITGPRHEHLSDAVNLCWKESYGSLKKMLSAALHHALMNEKDRMDLQDLIYGVEKYRYAHSEKAKEIKEIIKRESAYHEAGHILVGEILQPGRVGYSSIIRRGETEGRDGYVHTVEDFDRREDQVTELLAAKAAVEMVLGNAVNIGCVSDISGAMNEIMRMVLYSGQYGLEYAELYDDYLKEAPESRKKLDDKIYAIAVQQYEKAKEILCRHRDMLDRLADKLLKDGYILASEVRAICHPTFNQSVLMEFKPLAADCARTDEKTVK